MYFNKRVLKWGRVLQVGRRKERVRFSMKKKIQENSFEMWSTLDWINRRVESNHEQATCSIFPMSGARISPVFRVAAARCAAVAVSQLRRVSRELGKKKIRNFERNSNQKSAEELTESARRPIKSSASNKQKKKGKKKMKEEKEEEWEEKRYDSRKEKKLFRFACRSVLVHFFIKIHGERERERERERKKKKTRTISLAREVGPVNGRPMVISIRSTRKRSKE